MRHLGDNRRPGRVVLIATLLGNALGLPAGANNAPAPARLKSATVEAFNHYVRLTDARNDANLPHGAAPLEVDALAEAPRAEAYRKLQGGQVWIERVQIRDAGAIVECPDGMIHHWVGLVFVPGAKLGDVLAVLEDYNQHAVYYAPDVERSKTESRDGDHFRVFLRFRRRKVITVVLNTEHEVRYFHDSDTRAHSRSSAVRVAEVENPGKNDEREKTPGEDDGFLWRMETWWRIIEGDGGVYVQSEVVSLTRDIPTGLGWLIRPFVTSVPRESLTFTLQATRKAVEDRILKVSWRPATGSVESEIPAKRPAGPHVSTRPGFLEK